MGCILTTYVVCLHVVCMLFALNFVILHGKDHEALKHRCFAPIPLCLPSPIFCIHSTSISSSAVHALSFQNSKVVSLAFISLGRIKCYPIQELLILYTFIKEFQLKMFSVTRRTIYSHHLRLEQRPQTIIKPTSFLN